MKITIEALADGAEEEIIIRTNTMDSDIINLIYAVKAGRNRITAFYENEIVQLDSKEVYYFESVDNKVYACCEKKVFEIKQKLYELEEIYKQTDFVRISKSMIVNISKVSKIVPMFNGRLEGVLCNGEKVIITRESIENGTTPEVIINESKVKTNSPHTKNLSLSIKKCLTFSKQKPLFVFNEKANSGKYRNIFKQHKDENLETWQ